MKAKQKLTGKYGELLDPSSMNTFRTSLEGELLTSDSPDYDEVRKVWNGMIDRRPILIVRCANAKDVIKAMNFARQHNLTVSVRGGGHNVAGNAVCEGGLMIDLSLMKEVHVDTENRTVIAEPGLTWSEVDKETQSFGLATTGGSVSHTGISGLTLGGGLGWLMVKCGLTCDNLVSADVVTADGSLLKASKEENSDLFWAIRGGGGNFGIVTSFTYKLHEVGPDILGGMILYSIAHAKEVLSFYRDYVQEKPNDLTAFACLLTTPDCTPAVAILIGWFGALKDGEQYLKQVRNFAPPIADFTGQIPYHQLQTLFDESTPFGLRRYWKSGYFTELNDKLIETILKHNATKPSPLSPVLFFHMHGVAAEVNPDETAFGLRQKQWDIDIISQWTDPSEDENQIKWTRDFWNDIEPLSNGVYVNHLDSDDGASRVRAAYGNNYERLVTLKNKYDPQNIFHFNNNIEPTV